METATIPSNNDNARSTTPKRSNLDRDKIMELELRRLATFSSLKGDYHGMWPKGTLARAGLYYTRVSDTVKCDGCFFQYNFHSSGINPIEEHAKQSPECQFVLNYDSLLLNQCQRFSISSFTSELNNKSQLNLDDENEMDQDEDDAKDDSESQKLFLNTLSNETIDKLRENTFSTWPLITPNMTDMIKAGWGYTDIGDRVLCIYCDAIFQQWQPTDLPYEIHRLKSPKCPFVLRTETNLAKLSKENIRVTNEPTTPNAVMTVTNPYALATRRYTTFENWPHTDANPLPPVQSFVDAGFYYTGTDTIVKCFYCSGSLRNWQSSDEPKIEHCRWYPNCAYIRQFVGEDMYSTIQRKNREMKARQNQTDNKDNKTPEILPWTDNEIDRMVKARLDLPNVESLQKMGFSVSIIRKALEIQLRRKKDDFKTDHDFRMACLILYLEVKVINGNANNILVPETWIKQYLENQEQEIEKFSSQETPTSNSSIKRVRPRNVIARPKITPKSEDDSTLCVLCMATERQVACLPCGHLASCVSCGHSITTCPICRASIKAFVRVYI